MSMSSLVSRPFLVVSTIAVAVRLLLLVYAEWQDKYLEVKYTDVDYWVFSDAASAIWNGKSPFSRHTYRYTPVLALMLLPNSILGNNMWGKALFCACDLLAGYFIYLFLIRNTSPTKAAKLTAILWLLNPMVFTISTRGNAESVLSLLVLSSIYNLTIGHFAISGLLFGCAVHFKLFPIIYGVAILSYLLFGKYRKTIESPLTSPKLSIGNYETPNPSPISSPISSPTSSPTKLYNRNKNRFSSIPGSPLANGASSISSTPQKLATISKATLFSRFRNTLVFGLFALLSFGLLTYYSYRKFGDEYLNEAFWYHLSRKDHRHNFSPYFYLFYTERSQALPRFFELFTFIPQILFFIFAGLKFGKKDLPFACFIITFVFVTFNKVITSQYFIWYLSFFPIAFISLHNISKLKWTIWSLVWFSSQAIWLHFAYKLEFLGQEKFIHLWAASIQFLICNVWLAGQFIRHRFVPEILHAGPGIVTLNK